MIGVAAKVLMAHVLHFMGTYSPRGYTHGTNATDESINPSCAETLKVIPSKKK